MTFSGIMVADFSSGGMALGGDVGFWNCCRYDSNGIVLSKIDPLTISVVHLDDGYHLASGLVVESKIIDGMGFDGLI